MMEKKWRKRLGHAGHTHSRRNLVKLERVTIVDFVYCKSGVSHTIRECDMILERAVCLFQNDLWLDDSNVPFAAQCLSGQQSAFSDPPLCLQGCT